MNHPDPESCGKPSQGGAEAWTGAQAGWVSSSENGLFPSADAVRPCGRQHHRDRQHENAVGTAESQTPGMSGNSEFGNQEIPAPPAA